MADVVRAGNPGPCDSHLVLQSSHRRLHRPWPALSTDAEGATREHVERSEVLQWDALRDLLGLVLCVDKVVAVMSRRLVDRWTRLKRAIADSRAAA